MNPLQKVTKALQDAAICYDPDDLSARNVRELVERALMPKEPAVGAVAIIGKPGSVLGMLKETSVFQRVDLGSDPECWWNDRDAVWRDWGWICERDGVMADGGPRVYLAATS